MSIKPSPQRRLFESPQPTVSPAPLKLNIHENLSFININRLSADHLRVSDILYYLASNEFFTCSISFKEATEKTMILLDVEDPPEYLDSTFHSMYIPYNGFLNYKGTHRGLQVCPMTDTLTTSSPKNCTLGFIVYGTSHAKEFSDATKEPHRFKDPMVLRHSVRNSLGQEINRVSFTFPAYPWPKESIEKIHNKGHICYILDSYGIVRHTYSLEGSRHGSYLFYSNEYTITSNVITTALFQIFRLGNDLTIDNLVGPASIPHIESTFDVVEPLPGIDYDTDCTVPTEL
jgi:hypothetical protein